MTIEEILAALQAIIDSAVTDTGEERDLTDEEAQRYKELESKLAVARRSLEIRQRQQAYTTPVNGNMGLVQATPKQDNAEERAFSQYLRWTGRGAQPDFVQLRAQSEGVGSEGGYLVPDSMRDKFIERMVTFGGLANVVETITTTTGNPLTWNYADDSANVGEIVQEGDTFVGGADLVFTQKSLQAYSYASCGAGGQALRVSWELLQDASMDLESFIGRKLGERIARLQARHLVTGTGVGEPEGIVTAATQTIEMSTGGPKYDDLVDAIHSVDPAYRENARWVFNDTSLAKLQKVKDSHGDPIWRDRMAGLDGKLGEATLLGYPVTIDQAFGNVVDGGGDDDTWGVFGNLNEAYVIRRVRDVTLVVNPWARANYRQTEYSAWARMDARVQDPYAYVALRGYTA